MGRKIINYKNFKYTLDCDDGISFQINELDENGNIFKFISLIYSSDIGFKLFDLSDEVDDKQIEEEVIIEKENPFYESFLELLNNENELLIDDDFCGDDFVRYFKLQKEQDKINIVFHDEKSANDLDKYTVTIKNICHDLRSKIDIQELDTKKQLRTFFYNIVETFTIDNNKQKIKTF